MRTPAPTPKSGGLEAWLKDPKHKKIALLGGGGVAVAAFALYKKKTAAASSSATAGQPCTDINGNASVTDATGACILAAAPATAAVTYSSGGNFGPGNNWASDQAKDSTSIASIEKEIPSIEKEAHSTRAIVNEDNKRIKVLQDAVAKLQKAKKPSKAKGSAPLVQATSGTAAQVADAKTASSSPTAQLPKSMKTTSAGPSLKVA
jgi:hypothetical protein